MEFGAVRILRTYPLAPALRPRDVLFILVGGKNQFSRQRRQALNLGEQFDAGAAGKREVRQQQVGLQAGQPCEAIFHAAEFSDDVEIRLDLDERLRPSRRMAWSSTSTMRSFGLRRLTAGVEDPASMPTCIKFSLRATSKISPFQSMLYNGETAALLTSAKECKGRLTPHARRQ